MPKKSVNVSKPKKKLSPAEREELLIENFVGIQKAMTNLSIKFESMTDQINKLLEVFELSARNFVSGGGGEDNKDLLNKIDSLLGQNKTIAKGLVLIEDKIRRKDGARGGGFPVVRPSFSPPVQRMPLRPQTSQPSQLTPSISEKGKKPVTEEIKE